MNINKNFLIHYVLLFITVCTNAQNPIVRDQFSADPSARVFNGKVFVFPSHDIKAPVGKNLRKDWFCMADYHVFSSKNLTEWVDHGTIVSQNEVAWADSNAYSMWAPDCIERNGKYYFYFPAITNEVDSAGRKGFGIGIAVANKPEGPYIPQNERIKGVNGIDPNIFIDKDGQAYLYWSMRHIYVAKLSDDMLSLASEVIVVEELPQKGLKEGPYLFERNNVYYMTYPHVENKIERLEYAVGDNPMGPFKFAGVIMDESPMNCWTNHQSIVKYNEQWYLFYHQNEYSPKFDKNRSICIDSLFFNADGTIQKVTPTKRGVGLTNATSEIQIDRYSAKSEGATVAFLDTTNTFAGWETILPKKGDWVQYNAVDFGQANQYSLKIRVKTNAATTLRIKLDGVKGKTFAKVSVPACPEWTIIDVNKQEFVGGTHNLFIELSENSPVHIDWVSFKQN